MFEANEEHVMAVNEAERHHLYECARETWDEKAAETLIESFPHPTAELATKRDLAELRAELGDRIGELRSEMHGMTWRLIGAVALIVGVAETLGRVG